MSAEGWWQYRLHDLLARFPAHGMSADLASMSLADLWGLYLFLSGIADRGAP